MPRRSVAADVAAIDVDIKRPEDSAGEKDDIRSDDATLSITGSGGNTTIVTNNSNGDWFLQGVSVHALASAGVVKAEVQVRNSNDTILTRQVVDGSGGFANFFGQIVKPGWDVHLVVAQSDTNNYDVDAFPQFRKPDPEDTESGDPDTSIGTVDGFEDGEIGEYTGDTANFSVQSTTTFNGSNALQGGESGTDSDIYSQSGLDTYFNQGEEAKAYVRSNKAGSLANPVRSQIHYGVQDSNNHYTVQFNWHETDNLYLTKISGGSETVLDGPVEITGDFSADTWYRVNIVWKDDDTHTVDVYEAGTNTSLATLSATDSDFGGENGVGWGEQTETTGSIVFADQYEVIGGA